MSSFDDAIKIRQLAITHPPKKCYSVTAGASSLQFKDNKGLNWGFPWNHFIFVCHDDTGEPEKILLTFVSHEISISGHNLNAVKQEIADRRLATLRHVPSNHISDSKLEPIVTEILVKARDEKPGKKEPGAMNIQS